MIHRCGPAVGDGECEGRIVADEDGARWRLEGALTLGNARELFDQAQRLPPPSSGEIDCTALTAVDSAAVAVLLTLKRRAPGGLRFTGVPLALHALADVYAVDDLLGVG